MKSFHYPCRYFIALTQTGRQDLPVQMQLKRLTTSHPTEYIILHVKDMPNLNKKNIKTCIYRI